MSHYNDLEERWKLLELKLSSKIDNINDLEAILLFIGVRESGMPPKKFTETELLNLKEMAEHSILAPAKYYELIWVDDTGWPHFRPLQQVPKMDVAEKKEFLKEHILRYAEKNRLI